MQDISRSIGAIMKKLIITCILILSLLGVTSAATISGVSAVGCKIGPVLGPELFTNGDTELWDSTTDLQNWGESGTTNREATIIYGGNYSANTHGLGQYNQNITLVPNQKYRLSFWHRAGSSINCQWVIEDSSYTVHLHNDGTWHASPLYPSQSIASTTDWQHFSLDFTAHGSYSSYTFTMGGFVDWNPNEDRYFDDISIKEIQ